MLNSLKAGKSQDLISIVLKNYMSSINKTSSKFDINNMDAEQLTRALSEHQNTVIKLALIIGTLILVVMMFNDHHNKDRAIHAQISQVQLKLGAINNHGTAIQNLKDFQSSLPQKLNEIELITLISNYAKDGQVTISSLNPTESKDMGLYDFINVSFNAQSDDFKSMMLFLRKIEKSTFPLRIDTWSGHEDDSGKITFEVNVSAVLIHP